MSSSSAHSGSQAYGLYHSLKSVVWIAGMEQVIHTANANLALSAPVLVKDAGRCSNKYSTCQQNCSLDDLQGHQGGESGAIYGTQMQVFVKQRW